MNDLSLFYKIELPFTTEGYEETRGTLWAAGHFYSPLQLTCRGQTTLHTLAIGFFFIWNSTREMDANKRPTSYNVEEKSKIWADPSALIVNMNSINPSTETQRNIFFVYSNKQHPYSILCAFDVSGPLTPACAKETGLNATRSSLTLLCLFLHWRSTTALLARSQLCTIKLRPVLTSVRKTPQELDKDTDKIEDCLKLRSSYAFDVYFEAK